MSVAIPAQALQLDLFTSSVLGADGRLVLPSHLPSFTYGFGWAGYPSACGCCSLMSSSVCDVSHLMARGITGSRVLPLYCQSIDIDAMVGAEAQSL